MTPQDILSLAVQKLGLALPSGVPILQAPQRITEAVKNLADEAQAQRQMASGKVTPELVQRAMPLVMGMSLGGGGVRGSDITAAEARAEALKPPATMANAQFQPIENFPKGDVAEGRLSDVPASTGGFDPNTAYIKQNMERLNNIGVKVSSPEDIVTLYHGTNAKGVKGITESGKLNAGTFLATDKNASKNFVFGRGGDILEIKVPVKDLGFVQDSGMANSKGVSVQTIGELVKGKDGIYRLPSNVAQPPVSDVPFDIKKIDLINKLIGGK